MFYNWAVVLVVVEDIPSDVSVEAFIMFLPFLLLPVREKSDNIYDKLSQKKNNSLIFIPQVISTFYIV